MSVSQKCQYALRAVFELGKRPAGEPVTIGIIAKAQAIPARFLESILLQLRQGGFVESRRGAHGGYILARSAKELSVGEIIRFIDGPVGPVKCVSEKPQSNCPLQGNCAFMAMWAQARDAVAKVYDKTTFQNLIDEEKAASAKYVGNYSTVISSN